MSLHPLALAFQAHLDQKSLTCDQFGLLLQAQSERTNGCLWRRVKDCPSTGCGFYEIVDPKS